MFIFRSSRADIEDCQTFQQQHVLSAQSQQQQSSAQSSTPPSKTKIYLSKVLFAAQYLFAVIQGLTVYIISALLSIARLIQCKLSRRVRNGTRLSRRVIYLPRLKSNGEVEGMEGSELDKGSCTEFELSAARRGKRVENRQANEISSNYQTSFSTHVAIQKFWAATATVEDLGRHYFGTTATTKMEQRLQGQATDSDENQAQDITAASADMTDNDSYRIRSVLIRTISGNLIPQIKRVSFNDQAVVLNKNEGLEQQQQKEPWEDTGFQNIIAPRESTAHPELLIQCATQSRSSNNTSGDSMLDGITVTTQRCLDAFFLWNQVTLKPAASSAMATPVFSSLMAPVALLTVSATTVTAKAATSIDTASSMLMALPTATTSTHTSYQHSTNSNASGGRDNYTLMERSTSEPSKSTTFLQRYQQTQQQQQLRQRQPHTIEEEELEPIRPQTHERRESIKKLGLFQAPTAAISPQMTVTQHDDNDNNTDSSSHVVKAISDSTSQSHALGTNLSLGTRTRRSFSLVHPRSVQVNETTNLSSAFSHSKTQEYTALRRKSFDYNSFKTTPRLASEAPASAFTTEPQVSGRREEGAAVEHRNFMYRVAHPQRYKREIEQLHSELPQHSSK